MASRAAPQVWLDLEDDDSAVVVCLLVWGVYASVLTIVLSGLGRPERIVFVY